MLKASENTDGSVFDEDRQFWRYKNDNCAVGAYVTIMEFVYTHLGLIGDVPPESLLGKAFRSRHLLKEEEDSEALDAVHMCVLRGQTGADIFKFLSYTKMVEMQAHLVGSDDSLVASSFACHVGVKVCDGDFGRPTKKLFPVRITADNHYNVGDSLAHFVRSVQGPLPSVIHVNLAQDCEVTRSIRGIRVSRYDPEKGCFVEILVRYRFCAIVVNNGSHFEALLDCPDGVTWVYDSMDANGPAGQLKRRECRSDIVWPDADFISRGYGVDQVLFVKVEDVASRCDAYAVGNDALASSYQRNMNFLEDVTSPIGFRCISDPVVPDTLRGHAAILAEEVLRCLVTYGHKIHRDDDPRQPIMEYWSYDGLASDKKDVARFTPARYSEHAISAFNAIRLFVESGPLGTVVTQQQCAMRVAGFLIENVARKVLRSNDMSCWNLSKRETELAAHHRIMGSAASLEHRTMKRGRYCWPSSGMIRLGVPVAGYNHVDNCDDDRSAFVNVVVILTEYGGTSTIFFRLLGVYN